jgi:hypothetical protein
MHRAGQKFFTQKAFLRRLRFNETTWRTITVVRDLAKRMRNIHLSAADLGLYSGLSRPQVSEGMSGRRPLGVSSAQEVERWLSRLEDLHHRLAPIQPDFRDVENIRNVLTGIRTGTLEIKITNHSEPPPQTQGGVEALTHRDSADASNETEAAKPIRDIGDVLT